MLMQTILISAALLGGAVAGPARSTRDHSASMPGSLVGLARSSYVRERIRVYRKKKAANAAAAQAEAQAAAADAAARDAKLSQQNAKDTLSRYLCLQSGTC